MKTFKQLQESITKALKSFGGKGIRKVQPNVEINGAGRFNPDMDLKQFNRTQDLKDKFQNLNTPYKKGLFMKQRMVGISPGDEFDTVSNYHTSNEKGPILPRLARKGEVDKIDANVNLQRKYTARREDEMAGLKPTESGRATEDQNNISKGKGSKARKRAVELLKSRIKDS